MQTRFKESVHGVELGGSGLKSTSASRIAYFAYLVYVVVFLLSLPNRIPAIGVIRPTIVIAAFVGFFLLLEWSRLPQDRSVSSRRLLYFMLFIIVSLPFVKWPGSVLRGNLQDLIKVVLFFVFTVKLIDTEERLRTFVLVYLGCQLIRVFEPLYLHYTEGYWGDVTHIGGGEFMDRLSGGPVDRLINPNGLAFIIISIFPLLYYLLFQSSRAKYKVMFIGLAPFLIHALILTGSRSGLVGFAVAIAAIVVRSKRRLVALVLLSVTLAVALPFMPGELQDRYLSIFGMSETHSRTFDGRIAEWKGDFETFLGRPVVGHGIGTSLEASFNRTGSALVSHNMYTEALIETGAVGFVFFMSFIISIVLSSVAIRRRKSDSGPIPALQNTSYVVRLNDGLFVWAIVCLVFSMAQYGVSEYHWYVLGGLVAVSCRFSAQRRETESSCAE